MTSILPFQGGSFMSGIGKSIDREKGTWAVSMLDPACDQYTKKPLLAYGHNVSSDEHTA